MAWRFSALEFVSIKCVKREHKAINVMCYLHTKLHALHWQRETAVFMCGTPLIHAINGNDTTEGLGS
jgi:hypothetical protein